MFYITKTQTFQVTVCFEQSIVNYLIDCSWSDSPQWARASSITKFLDHTQRSTTVGRTPLEE